MIRAEEHREDLQLNMTPMVDMVFLLIIFFLTATTFSEKEREQDVLLPSVRGGASLSRQLENKLVINVLQDGGLRVQGGLLEDGELLNVVRERKSRALKPLKVMVRADKRTPYGHVARTLGLVERAGVARPYVVTRMVEMDP